jgi:histidine phosphotransfer protein HptB
MPMSPSPETDWPHVVQARAALGPRFAKVSAWFREEGVRALSEIEDALRSQNAVAMIDPAERLKSCALDIGAERLATLAETIEFDARDCVEWHQSPAVMLEAVVILRTAFGDLVSQIETVERAGSPLIMRNAATHRFAQTFGN